MSTDDGKRKSRPDNLTFVGIPLSDTPRETGELSFVLKPSAISGVGVFVTHPVCKGASLALFVDDRVRRVSYAELDRDRQRKAFCLVYGIETAEDVCTPLNFAHMEIGWYLNHSSTPNAVYDGQWIAARDIAAGEEITIDYSKSL